MRSATVVLVCLALLAVGCGEGDGKGGAGQGARPALAGKRAVLVIAPRDFRDEELQEPLKLLRASGCMVAIACSSLDEAAGMKGARVKPGMLLKDVKAADFDAVVFVGGVGASVYFDDPTAQALARQAAADGRVVGAICVAPSILARAGVLKGKRATAWSSQKDDLERGGALWAEEPVVRDGKLVTGNGPEAAKPFAELLVEALGEPASP
ncbi:MAG: DJ-1/PfpI family protein [Planctomycetes bacterium]|nr:DJ-1/PfpI family protein [Planctomycetota bacterium]